MIAAPAVLGAGFVIDFATIVGVLRRLEKVIDRVHGVIQKVVVRLAEVEVDLAFDFRFQSRAKLKRRGRGGLRRGSQRNTFAVIRRFTT